MPFAYWCVLVAALMPYVLVAYAKSSSRNNYNPRDSAQKLEGAKRRAYAAHQNSFEVFPFFAVAVIASAQLGGSISTINWLAGLFILTRLAYAACYLANIAAMRSLIWLAGLIINIAIFVLPAIK